MNTASIQVIIDDKGNIEINVVGDKGSYALEVANDIMLAAADGGGYDYDRSDAIHPH